MGSFCFRLSLFLSPSFLSTELLCFSFFLIFLETFYLNSIVIPMKFGSINPIAPGLPQHSCRAHLTVAIATLYLHWPCYIWEGFVGFFGGGEESWEQGEKMDKKLLALWFHKLVISFPLPHTHLTLNYLSFSFSSSALLITPSCLLYLLGREIESIIKPSAPGGFYIRPVQWYHHCLHSL